MDKGLERRIAALQLMRHRVDETFNELGIRPSIEELETRVANDSATPLDYKMYGRLSKTMEDYKKLIDEFDFAFEYIADGEKARNGTLDDAKRFADDLVSNAREFLLTQKFTEPYDSAVLAVQGAHCTKKDENELSQKLLNAYLKFAEGKRFKVKVLDHSDNAFVLRIDGDNAYNYYKGEAGIHKFVVYSCGRRQTRHFSVGVLSQTEDDPKELDYNQVSIELFSGSTKGGQNANKRKTNVRVKYKPTGVEAVARGRSQHQNLKKAYETLRSRIQACHKSITVRINHEMGVPSGSGYSRAYHLTRDMHIVDTSSGYFTRDTESFFKGEIMPFIFAYYKI